MDLRVKGPSRRIARQRPYKPYGPSITCDSPIFVQYYAFMPIIISLQDFTSLY